MLRMNKVLHYKTKFLNKSETFINRLIQNHERYNPVALCYRRRSYSRNIQVYEAPRSGWDSVINDLAFHGNLSLPFYRNVIQKESPDCIHAHFGYDAVKLRSLALRLGVPLVVSFYGADVSRLPEELGWKRRYRKLAEDADHFIAASAFMKSQLLDLGFPDKKISVVRFGIQLSHSHYNENLPDDPKLMMVGRMVEKKGFEFAIRAVAELKKRGIDIDFNLYGDGPLMESLTNLTRKLDLQDTVRFHGYQPIETILDAHHDHSILLAPSVTAKDGDMEGLPNTILEAMAKGTFVVASRHAAIPEVIRDGETGFLAEEKDTGQLADKIEKVIRNYENLEPIRRNARQLIEKKYSVERMVREIEEIYDLVK